MSGDFDSYVKWKASVPLLYDWFAHHSLAWPSLTCRLMHERLEDACMKEQRIYFAEQTNGSQQHVLSIGVVDVCKARVASGESINSWNDTEKCPHVSTQKEIMHPGEVNKVRECPLHPDVLVTHTDSPLLYVWNGKITGSEDEGGYGENRQEIADLILAGHEDIAQYALGLSDTQPRVASGGRDHKILIWNLEDHVSSLMNPKKSDPATVQQLSPQIVLTGHERNIEDLVFKPNSSDELVSVSDDCRLLFWDCRSHHIPIANVSQAHGETHLHCADWSRSGNYIATGAADGSLKVWDRRMLTSHSACAFAFSFHKKAIMRVEWDPFNQGILASGGEDAVICIWDLFQSRVRSSEVQENKRARRSVPTELLFQHNGHKCIIIDFQWNPSDPWTLLSVSDDVALDRGGGTLQMWRVSDLIHRPEHEVLQELQQHAYIKSASLHTWTCVLSRQWIVSGKMENGSTSGITLNGCTGDETGL